MAIEYYPASSTLPTESLTYKGRSAFWFAKNPIAKYDKVLFSYQYGGAVVPSYRDMYIGDHIKSIIGDSGGFSAASLGVKLDPIDVIRWENNFCDIGFTLDLPPFDSDPIHGGFLTGDKMVKCADISNKNAEIMMSRKSEDLKLYLVVQGNSRQTRQDWLDGGMKEYNDWDGFSLSVKPQHNPYTLIDWLKFAIDNDMKDIHILGVTGKLTMGVLVYFSEYFNSVKVDSSSHAKGSRYRKYILPAHLGRDVVMTERDGSVPTTLPCDCEVCRFFKEYNVFNQEDVKSSLVGFLINAHNMIQYTRYVDLLNWTFENAPSLYPSLVPGLRKMIDYGEKIINGDNGSLSDWV